VVSNVLGTVGNGESFDKECPALAELFGSASKYKMNGAEEIPEVVIKAGRSRGNKNTFTGSC
jgi:hypothetical protein